MHEILANRLGGLSLPRTRFSFMSSFGTDDGIDDIIRGGGDRIEIEKLKFTPIRPTSPDRYYK